jgi:hypothetical protein
MEAGVKRGGRFQIGTAILAYLTICAIFSTSIHATEYRGSVGPFAGRARIEFSQGNVSGYLCVDRGVLSLTEDGYEIDGTLSSGSIKGKISRKNVIGDLLAKVEEDDSQSTVKGTLAIGGRRLSLKLSKDKSKVGEEPEILFRKEDVYSGLLRVTVAPSDYDRALEVLKGVPEAQIQPARADDQDSPFLYDAFVDECTRRLVKYITFNLKISPPNLENTYQRLEATKLFRGLATVPMEMGQIFILGSELVDDKAPTSSGSAVAPSLLKEYFGRLLPAQSCRRYTGSNLVQALVGKTEPLAPVSLQFVGRDDLGSIKAIVSGKSESLFFRQPGVTERYELDFLLYPGKSG